jgi:hypothetical protein
VAKQQDISRQDLYKNTFDYKKFSILVGSKVYRTVYFKNSNDLKLGMVVVFNSVIPGQAKIGIICGMRYEENILSIRVIPSLKALVPDNNSILSVHTDDVHCYLQPTTRTKKKETAMYRLWFQYDNKGSTKEVTIKVDGNLSHLQSMRRSLQERADKVGVGLYQYYIETI